MGIFHLGTVVRVVVRRALRLTADDDAVLAQAHDWFEREPRLDKFTIPAGAIERMGMVRTGAVILERFVEQFRPFETWLDDHTEAQHGRKIDPTLPAAVVVLDPQSSQWSK